MPQASDTLITPPPFDVSAFKPESVTDWFAVWQYRVALDHMLTIAAEGEQGTPEFAAMEANWRATQDAAERVGATPAEGAEGMRRKLAVLRWALEDLESSERHRWAPLLDGLEADLTGSRSDWRHVPASIVAMLADTTAKALEAAEAAALALCEPEAPDVAEAAQDQGGAADAAYSALSSAVYQVRRLAEVVRQATGGRADG